MKIRPVGAELFHADRRIHTTWRRFIRFLEFSRRFQEAGADIWNFVAQGDDNTSQGIQWGST